MISAERIDTILRRLIQCRVTGTHVSQLSLSVFIGNDDRREHGTFAAHRFVSRVCVPRLVTHVGPHTLGFQWEGLAVGAVTILAAGVVIGVMSRDLLRTVSGDAPSSELPLRKFEVAINAEYASAPVISPDGTKIVYESDGRLWLRELSRSQPREIPNTEGAVDPFWSADGEWLGFGASASLWKVPVSGGAKILITALPGTFTTRAAIRSH